MASTFPENETLTAEGTATLEELKDATERDGIPILKRLFAESELESFRARLSHAQPGAARVAFHRQTTPLLLWMLLIAAALAYFQLVGEGRAR